MQITLNHPTFLDLSVTLARPTEAAWSDAFTTISEPGGSMLSKIAAAGYNLLISCLTKPSEAEVKRMVEDDWPALPSAVFTPMTNIAGALRFEGEDVNAWRFDLLATLAAAKVVESMLPDDGRIGPIVAEFGAATEALTASGLTLEACAELLARFNRPGQLQAIRTRDYGVLIIRRPRFTTESLVFSSNMSKLGAYEATKRLALACTEHPVNGAISSRFADAPALATSIGNLAQSMVNAGLGGEVKKG